MVVHTQVWLLCSIYAHFIIELKLEEGQTSLPLGTVNCLKIYPSEVRPSTSSSLGLHRQWWVIDSDWIL